VFIEKSYPRSVLYMVRENKHT